MSSSSSCVEWSWQRAQGRPSRTPAALRQGDDRQAAATGRRAPGCAARWRPAAGRAIAATGAAVWPGVAPRGAAAGVPAASRDRRRARAPGAGRRVPGSGAGPSQRVVAPGSGRTRPGRERRCLRAPARPVAGPPAGWRRLPPAGSARASGPVPEPGRESAGAGRPTPGSVRDRRRGRPGRCQARLQSVAGIVATATRETSLEIQFGAAGERQVEVRTVHSACHSSCR